MNQTSDNRYLNDKWSNQGIDQEKERREHLFYVYANEYSHGIHDRLIALLLNMRINSLHLNLNGDISDQILKVNRELKILKDLLNDELN